MPIRDSPGRPKRGEPSAPSRQRAIRIPLEIDKLLEALAVEERVSVQREVRDAIVFWLKAKGKI